MMKLLSSLFTLLILLLNAAFPAAAETVKIANIIAKTGRAAVDADVHGFTKLPIEEFNRQGGLLGRSIELVELDNQSTALGSKEAAEKAVKINAVAVVGASYSSHSLAMAPVLQAARIPMLSPDSTHPQVTLVGDYIFRTCFIDPFQGRVMARFAFQDLEAKTAAVLINADNKYSEGLAENFVRSYNTQGGKILFQGYYLDKSVDFTSLIEKIKALNPEVVFVPGYRKDSAYIIKQARSNGLSTTFIGGDGWSNRMYDVVGNVIEGNYYSTHWHPDSPGSKSRQFVEKYKNRVEKLDYRYALNYDCVSLMLDAIRRAGSFDPTKIRNALAATGNYEGVTGNIRFDKNGDPIKPAVVLQFSRGTSVYVKNVDP